ncbi:hypothetical protein [Legionella spiritensis]|uniref:Uncharacterized protein n=1 Tax=Legionella spiritensis TaxID=452 RepID=A0A0W0ZAX9_LEGSP|nr:hypothetical protein [Legionella spiritensis]KTD66272.1 hypothetical protein Lspi_0035 [Legionella spiritensis]SNV48423.1 Uncharacterised protein [Legionella spiritensis]
MLVYFEGIEYKGKPLVWELHKNKATCLFQVAGSDEKLDPEAVLESLTGQALPGVRIRIKKNSATIRHASKYSPVLIEDHPEVKNTLSLSKSSQELSSVEPRTSSSKLQTLKRTLSNSSFSLFKDNKDKITSSPRSPRSTEKTQSGSATTLPDSDSEGASDRDEKEISVRSLLDKYKEYEEGKIKKRRAYSSVALLDLFDEGMDATKWRDTIAVRDKFSEVSGNDLKRLGATVHTHNSLLKVLQLEIGQTYYPLRNELLDQVEALLTGILNPIYQEWIEHHPIEQRPYFYSYMQKAVQEIMVANPELSRLPTEYEQLSEEAYKKQFDNNDARFEFMNHKALLLRAEGKMPLFMALTHPDYPVHAGVADVPESSIKYALRTYKNILPLYNHLVSQSFIKESYRDRLQTMHNFVTTIKMLLEYDKSVQVLFKSLEKEPMRQLSFKDLLKDKTVHERVKVSTNLIDRHLTGLLVHSFKENLAAEGPELSADIQRRLRTFHETMTQIMHADRNAEIQRNHLQGRLEQKVPVIHDYHSFRHFIETILTGEGASDKKSRRHGQLAALVETITTATIKAIAISYKDSREKSNVERIRNTDTDFYLSTEWEGKIRNTLDELERKRSSLTQLREQPDKEKIVNPVVAEIAGEIAKFVIEASEEHDAKLNLEKERQAALAKEKERSIDEGRSDAPGPSSSSGMGM